MRTRKLFAVAMATSVVITGSLLGTEPANAVVTNQLAACSPATDPYGCTAISKAPEPQQLKEPAGPSSTAEFEKMDPKILQAQRVLGSFDHWVRELPGVYDSGYVTSRIYQESMGIEFFWAGFSPAQDQIRDEALRRGITVTFKSVKYSKRQLDDGATAIYASAGQKAWGTFVATSTEGTDLTHDGLVVKGHYTDVTPQRVSAEQLNDTLNVAKALAPAVVQVVLADPPVALGTRSTSQDPFYAGGQMRAYTGRNHCSSGFSVIVPWANNGTAHTTTARHCDTGNYVAWDLPSSTYGSNVTTTPSGGKVLTGHGSPFVFDGA